MHIDAGDLGMESLGRIVQLDVRLCSVCPNKRVALAVLLSEADREGNEYPRGMKTMTIPAHTGDACRDATVRNIIFVPRKIWMSPAVHVPYATHGTSGRVSLPAISTTILLVVI